MTVVLLVTRGFLYLQFDKIECMPATNARLLFMLLCCRLLCLRLQNSIATEEYMTSCHSGRHVRRSITAGREVY